MVFERSQKSELKSLKSLKSGREVAKRCCEEML